jgi:hypothetical protein
VISLKAVPDQIFTGGNSKAKDSILMVEYPEQLIFPPVPVKARLQMNAVR